MLTTPLQEKPIRSLLFMPGDNARAQRKAADMNSDGLTFDLEDAVAANNKLAARKQVALSLVQNDYENKVLLVRINHPSTQEAEEDVKLLAERPQLSGLVIPKAESAQDVQMVAAWMERYGCSDKQRIYVMLETPLGIMTAPEIASAHPRMAGLIAGTNDLITSLHLPLNPSRHSLHYALSRIVLVARAKGLQALDGVFNRIHDESGFAQECADGRALGFDGKTIIHPSQIEPANTIFSPSVEEIATASKIIERWKAQKKGVTTAGGTMIEELHVRNAQRILALHQLLRS